MVYKLYENLPVVLKQIILEYKCGAELWDVLLEHDARPDVGMSVTPFENKWYGFDQDEIGLEDMEYFHHLIFHSLRCRLIMVAHVFNQEIMIEVPDKNYHILWSTGNYKLDTKVGIQVFNSYLKRLKLEIRDHYCTTKLKIRAPTKREWFLDETLTGDCSLSFFDAMRLSYEEPKQIYKALMRDFSFV
jgi:hypothetical protein